MCFGIIWDVLTQLSNILSIICGIVLVPLQLLLFQLNYEIPFADNLLNKQNCNNRFRCHPADLRMFATTRKQTNWSSFSKFSPNPLFPMTSNFLPWGNIWSFGQLFRRQNHHHHKHQLGKILDWLVGLSVEKIWILNSLQQQTHSQSLIVMINRIVSTIVINTLQWTSFPVPTICNKWQYMGQSLWNSVRVNMTEIIGRLADNSSPVARFPK